MKTPSSENPSSSPETRTCPSCKAEIPADAPHGLCPVCLVNAAAAEETLPLSGSNSALQCAPLDVGDLDALLPDYDVIELIGRGGMGAVYKARQVKLDRMVAIKVLPDSIAADVAFKERFTREAQALAKLSHSNIVTVHDVDSVEEHYYIVMEYVDGANLRAVLKTGNLVPKEALAIVVQICEALQCAHDAGIVHRDIKPENILLTKKGEVKIADFGLVKLIGGSSPDFEVSLTATHQAMGTLQYMAPEQLSGSVEADHRADIYSLGVVFYEMLTGEIPAGRFDSPSQRVEVDMRLDEVVLRALDGQPERRYQSADDLKTDVELITGNGDLRENPPIRTNASATTDGQEKYSIKAILGAVWMALVFPAAIPWFIFADMVGSQSRPGLSELVIILVVTFPFLLAPIGTTILGAMALSDVRRSRGSLRGGILAFIDTLFFPVIAINALLFFLICLIVIGVMNKFLDSTWQHPVHYPLLISLIIGIISCAILNFRLLPYAWKRYKEMVADFPEDQPI